MAGTPATIPRKRPLLLKKVSSFLWRSAYLTKMSNPFVPCLALLKRSAGPGGFDRAGNYRFLQEYEFSPSRTPLFHRYYRKKLKLKLTGRRSFKEDVRSLLVLCSCLGRGRSSGCAEEDRFFAAGKLIEPAREASDGDDGGDSVDLRAVRRFYEEMRMQRRLSI